MPDLLALPAAPWALTPPSGGEATIALHWPIRERMSEELTWQGADELTDVLHVPLRGLTG